MNDRSFSEKIAPPSHPPCRNDAVTNDPCELCGELIGTSRTVAVTFKGDPAGSPLVVHATCGHLYKIFRAALD